MKRTAIATLVLSAVLALSSTVPVLADTTTTDITTKQNTSFATGYPDATFKPDQTITRAEVASLLTHAFGWQGQTSSFPDLTVNKQKHWADLYVGALQQKKLISGYPDGSFKPDQTITRAEMASILDKLYTGKTDLTVAPFTDVKSDFWGRTAILSAAKKGIISGYGEGLFGPDDKLTRAQAVTMILNTQDRKPDPKLGSKLNTGIKDIHNELWYAPYVLSAIQTYQYRVVEDATTKAKTETVTFADNLKHIASAKVVDESFELLRSSAQIELRINGLIDKVGPKQLTDAGYKMKYTIVGGEDALVSEETGEYVPRKLKENATYQVKVDISKKDGTKVVTATGQYKTGKLQMPTIKSIGDVLLKNGKMTESDIEVMKLNPEDRINAGTLNGIQKSATVMVGEKVALDSLKGVLVEDGKDVTEDLKAYVTSETSSNPDVASFIHGTLFAKKAGKTTLTFHLGDKKVTKEITVVANAKESARKITSIKVTPTERTVVLRSGANAAASLTLEILDQYGDPVALSEDNGDVTVFSASEYKRNPNKNQAGRDFHYNNNDLKIVVPDAKNVSEKLFTVSPLKLVDGVYSIDVGSASVAEGFVTFYNVDNEKKAEANLKYVGENTGKTVEARNFTTKAKVGSLVLDLTNASVDDDSATLYVQELAADGTLLSRMEITSATAADNTIVTVEAVALTKQLVKVTGLKAGKTTIQLEDKDGRKLTVPVEVKKQEENSIVEVDKTVKTDTVEKRIYRFNELLDAGSIITNNKLSLHQYPITLKTDGSIMQKNEKIGSFQITITTQKTDQTAPIVTDITDKIDSFSKQILNSSDTEVAELINLKNGESAVIQVIVKDRKGTVITKADQLRMLVFR